jgi:hypothetical protein
MLSFLAYTYIIQYTGVVIFEYTTPKLSSACYIIRCIKPFMSLNTLKNIYNSYFNTIISYSLPFWGNSPHSIKIFRMQKRIIRIMIGCKSRVSCRNLFRRMEILLFVSQYILSLMLFVVKNKNLLFLIQRIILKVQDNLIIFISP